VIIKVTKTPAPEKEKRTTNPDPIDVHVGIRLRLRRNLLGLSQEKLSKVCGLTFQQIQKYERGTNRMGASRLYQLAKGMDVPVSYFFEEMGDDQTSSRTAAGFAENDQAPLDEARFEGSEFMYRREVMELIRAYNKITDIKTRRKVYELIKSMADSE
jgi:transcriptional regulator with XRE-family HTH domain